MCRGVFFVQFYVITLIMVLAEIYYFVTSPWPCLKDGTTTPQGAFTVSPCLLFLVCV